jgi:lipopolysaccharide heptosyltransferase I
VSRILVIKPSSLGDVVHTLPAVDLLHRHLPDARLSWVVNEEFCELLGLYPALERVIPFRRRRWNRPWHWGELVGFARELRAGAFDACVDFQGLLRSAWIGRLSRAPRRIGFAAAREGAARFYTEAVQVPPELRHAVDRNIELVRRAFGVEGTASFPALVRSATAGVAFETRLAAAGVAAAAPRVAVAPVARWGSKTWPAEFFAAVLDAATEQVPEACFWLLGTQSERSAGEGVRAACARARPLNLMGCTSLPELIEGLHASRLLLTNDSGPMHLAAAIGRPVLALFGATDPTLTGPYGSQHAVFVGACPHGPCFRRSCPRPDVACAASVSPLDVAAELVLRIRRDAPVQPAPA